MNENEKKVLLRTFRDLIVDIYFADYDEEKDYYFTIKLLTPYLTRQDLNDLREYFQGDNATISFADCVPILDDLEKKGLFSDVKN